MNRRRFAWLLALVAVIALIAISPILLGTSTLPVAVVEGNSMYPNLQNGDLVIFRAPPKGVIPNDTIIVYVQGSTGDPILDMLTRPTVIHRVVGIVVQSDGVVYYRTKGDGNQFVDPQLVRQNNVIGVPLYVIPKMGIVFMFFQSPQGEVAVIGVVTLWYIGVEEAKRKERKEADQFLGSLAEEVVEGRLPPETFEKVELSIRYLSDADARKLCAGDELAMRALDRFAGRRQSDDAAATAKAPLGSNEPGGTFPSASRDADGDG
jgi:signal peptidase